MYILQINNIGDCASNNPEVGMSIKMSQYGNNVVYPEIFPTKIGNPKNLFRVLLINNIILLTM